MANPLQNKVSTHQDLNHSPKLPCLKMDNEESFSVIWQWRSGSIGLACVADGECRMEEDVGWRMWDGGVVMEGEQRLT